MRSLLSSFYGVCAYVASQAVLMYLIGFSGNLWVPKSVDVGGAGSWRQALAVDLLLLALFGVQHSVMARRAFKRRWARLLPFAVERSTYLWATCVVFALLFRFWVPIREPIVWRVEHGAGVAVLWGLFAAGWVLALASTFLIDHFELFGLRQAFSPLARRPPPEPQFRTPLLYRWVRHPLYTGLLLSLWAVPVMTTGRLLFALGLTVYILTGIRFEERDLVRQFGAGYLRYREQVGMLIPKWRALLLRSRTGSPPAPASRRSTRG